MGTVGEWVFGIAAKKGAVQVASSLLALIGADQFAGVDTTTVQKVLIALIVGLLNIGRNWLKVAKGVPNL